MRKAIPLTNITQLRVGSTLLTKRKNRTSCLSVLQKSSNFQFKYRNRLKSNKDIYKKDIH